MHNCFVGFGVSNLYNLVLIRDHGDFKSTIKERISTMYLNEWLADVYFLVGTEPVSCCGM